MSGKVRMVVGSDNVFRDLGFPEPEAQNLLLRADLMIAIQRYLRRSGLSQTEAARKLRITQPRLSDLARHRIERFSLDAGRSASWPRTRATIQASHRRSART